MLAIRMGLELRVSDIESLVLSPLGQAASQDGVLIHGNSLRLYCAFFKRNFLSIF